MRGAPPYPIQKDQRDRPQHRELRALLFSMSVWVLYKKHERKRNLSEKKLKTLYCYKMLTSNHSEGENQKVFDVLCSTGSTEEISYELTGLVVFNVFLALTTTVGNTLILVALNKISSLHPLSKLLFRNLAATNLCVGVIAQPLYIAYVILLLTENWKICRYILVASYAVGSILGGVSLPTLTAISVDRLLALLFRLRNRQAVTLRRPKVLVFSIWALASVCTAMNVLSYNIAVKVTIIAVSLYLTTSICSYTCIFFALRHHQSQIQIQNLKGQVNRTTPLNIARYRKAVSSSLWVQLVLVACYLPYGIVVAMRAYAGLPSVVFLVAQCTITLVYLNSCLNPVIYCWRIKELRQVVKQTVREFFSLWS